MSPELPRLKNIAVCFILLEKWNMQTANTVATGTVEIFFRSCQVDNNQQMTKEGQWRTMVILWCPIRFRTALTAPAGSL